VTARELLVAAVLLAAPLGAQEKVELTDGRVLEGRVMYADAERVVVRIDGRDRELDADEVLALDTIRASQRVLFAREASVAPQDVTGNLELAKYARARGLDGEASVFFWRVVLADPQNVEAHEALGHDEHRDRWTIEHDRHRYRGLDDLREATADWKHAFELRTAHFDLRTNLPLEQAVEVAIDLERFYNEFYELWQEDLGLYECTERMNVFVHADSRSFPEGRGGSASYFDPGPNTLRINASVDYRRDVLAHECSHQLFYNATRLDRAFSADFPAWLDEGLAEYVAASVVRRPQPLALDRGYPHLNHLATFTGAEDPLSLARVLSLTTNDFHNHTHTNLMYAQSYALVHYGLHADGRAVREAFLDYVRQCIDGKSSPTRFKDTLDVDRDFEEQWLDYAREVLGR